MSNEDNKLNRLSLMFSGIEERVLTKDTKIMLLYMTTVSEALHTLDNLAGLSDEAHKDKYDSILRAMVDMVDHIYEKGEGKNNTTRLLEALKDSGKDMDTTKAIWIDGAMAMYILVCTLANNGILKDEDMRKMLASCGIAAQNNDKSMVIQRKEVEDE